MPAPPPPPRSELRTGMLYALTAFTAWGLVPLYFRAVAAIPPVEILAHRVTWSLVLLAVLLTARSGWPRVRTALRDRRSLLVLCGSAVLVSVNWLTFIVGTTTGRVVECSLGYFMSPLVNVLLGTVVLRERLRRAQVVAVVLAAVAVALSTAALGRVPAVALVLAGSWGLYGLVRKTVRVDSVEGLTVETTLLVPIALGYLVWLGARGDGHFATGAGISVLLACSGIVTALPLIWFVHGARRLPLSTLGLFQYVAPTLQFLLGVAAFGEPFPPLRAAAFALTWVGLVVFSVDLWRHTRR